MEGVDRLLSQEESVNGMGWEFTHSRVIRCALRNDFGRRFFRKRQVGREFIATKQSENTPGRFAAPLPDREVTTQPDPNYFLLPCISLTARSAAAMAPAR